jgi:hypothetical protein
MPSDGFIYAGWGSHFIQLPFFADYFRGEHDAHPAKSQLSVVKLEAEEWRLLLATQTASYCETFNGGAPVVRFGGSEDVSEVSPSKMLSEPR